MCASTLKPQNKWFEATAEALLQVQLTELKFKKLRARASTFRAADLFSKDFWFSLKNLGLRWFEKAEGKLISFLAEKPKAVIYTTSLLAVGLLPVVIQFASDLVVYKSKQKQEKIQAILEEGQFAQSQRKYTNAQINFETALKLAPDHGKANADLAALYLTTGRLSHAEPYLQRLSSLQKGQNIYWKAIEGLTALQKGDLLGAEKLLSAAYDHGIDEVWLTDSLGVALIANHKGQRAFKLAGWPIDCQCNAGAHASCMEKLSNWHGEVADLQFKQAEKLKGPKADQLRKEAIHNQKRQIIFLGESMRSLLQAIEEVDGNYRLELIEQFEANKKKLNRAYAVYTLQSHFLSNQISSQDLTPGEKRSFPV